MRTPREIRSWRSREGDLEAVVSAEVKKTIEIILLEMTLALLMPAPLRPHLDGGKAHGQSPAVLYSSSLLPVIAEARKAKRQSPALPGE